MKRTISILIALIMVIALIPMSAFAEEDVIRITNAEELMAISEQRGHFVLENDIVFEYVEVPVDPENPENLVKGFVTVMEDGEEPVETEEPEPTFQGWEPLTIAEGAIFDGQGHTIYGIKTEAWDFADVGFIGENYGTVKNLNLDDCTIYGGKAVGILTGYNAGTIENCHVVRSGAASVSIFGYPIENVDDYGYVGSISGYNEGTIDMCSATLTSVAGYQIIGGLVGMNGETGSITRSWTKNVDVNYEYVIQEVSEYCIHHAEVEAVYEERLVYSYNGGLVGVNLGSIKDAFANDIRLFGFDCLGGLIGTNFGNVENAYAGTIGILYQDKDFVYIDDIPYNFDAEYVHPCVGNNGGVLKNVYYKEPTSNIPSCYANLTNNGIVKTDAELRMESTFIGFDFGSVWTIDQNENNGYPFIGVKTTYVVNFIDFDGAVLSTQRVAEGQDAQAPANPSREGYVFVGWDKDFTNVRSDLDVYAVYEEAQVIPETYTVTFVGFNGEVISEQQVNVGEDAVAPTEVTAPEGYEFKGWDKDFTNVHEDLIVNAVFEKISFTVTFVDFDGSVIEVQAVAYGEDAVSPENKMSQRDFYVFLGWDTEITDIKSDLTVNARYGLLGDVDLDGQVDTADATQILRYLAEIRDFTPDLEKIADVDRSSKVTTLDVQDILMYVAKLSDQPK